MAFGIFYLIVHFLAITTAIAFIFVRSRWIWAPYIVVMLLEVPVLWRVLGTKVTPVWLSDPISFGLAAAVFWIPLLRWLRTRSLLQNRFEIRGIIFIAAVHLLSAGAAAIESYRNHGEGMRTATVQLIRDHAIEGAASEIERLIADTDQNPAFQRDIRGKAIRATLTYSDEDIAIDILKTYPEALVGADLMFAIQQRKAEFLNAALQQRPDLLVALSKLEEGPVALAAHTGSQLILVTLLHHMDALENTEIDPSILLHAASNGHLAVVNMLLKRFPESVNLRDGQGMTPLMHSVAPRGKHGVDYADVPEIASQLIAAGADVNAVDKEGRSVLTHALSGPVWSTLPETVRRLRSAGAKAPNDFNPDTPFQPTKVIHFEGLSNNEQKRIWADVLSNL